MTEFTVTTTSPPRTLFVLTREVENPVFQARSKDSELAAKTFPAGLRFATQVGGPECSPCWVVGRRYAGASFAYRRCAVIKALLAGAEQVEVESYDDFAAVQDLDATALDRRTLRLLYEVPTLRALLQRALLGANELIDLEVDGCLPYRVEHAKQAIVAQLRGLAGAESASLLCRPSNRPSARFAPHPDGDA